VADLEADVEDPTAWDDWQEDEVEGTDGVSEQPNCASTSNANGIHPGGEETHDITNGATDSDDDGVLATMATRNLIITNPENPDVSSEDMSHSPQPPGSGLLSRRNGSFTHAREISTSKPLDIPGRTSTSASRSERSRSLTIQNDEDHPGDSSLFRATTPTAPHTLEHEGPMTPRNDAGPFVFDGSAGRASGRRIVASLAEAADDPASSSS